MGLFSSSSTSFPWKELISIQQLNEIIASSNDVPVLIFKHSTRCSISSMVKSQFERKWNVSDTDCEVYYLDLIAHRDVSNEIETLTKVTHQSPQAIVLKNGLVVYHDSHNGVDAAAIAMILNKN
jgi:bacillithiol system protein YtxJ